MLVLRLEYTMYPQYVLWYVRSRRRAEEQVTFVCDAPRTEEETSYLKFFEEFQPIFCHDGSLVGDEVPGAQKGFDLRCLAAPALSEAAHLPMCLEQIEKLCDLSIYQRNDIDKWLAMRCALEKCLLIEEPEWPAEAMASAKSIHIKADMACVERFISYSWPELRLAVISESDLTIPHSALVQFLEQHPNVHIWLTNNAESHPRIRTLPIFLENRRWRNWRREVEPGRELEDTPIEIHRKSIGEREYTIGMTQCWPTNSIRPIWTEFVQESCRDRSDFMVFPKVDSETFLENMESCRAVICPPGNGVDTHRHWETMLTGGYAIVQANAHTRNLQREYPSLPLIPIEQIEDVLIIQIPPETPSPFHPMFLRVFWQSMVESHLRG
jgi:hypothetical protein